MAKLTINLSDEYSATPLGRYRKHGSFSGERFRDEFLVPNIGMYDLIEINFEGVAGLPSSFLEEAFGGLVRLGLIDVEGFRKTFKIVANTPSLSLAEERIMRYVESAKG